MPKEITAIEKRAWGFAALFFGLLDGATGTRFANGRMIGLLQLTRIAGLGRLGAGTPAVRGALISASAARISFRVLGVWYSIDVAGHLRKTPFTRRIPVNTPHILILSQRSGLPRRCVGPVSRDSPIKRRKCQ